MKMLKFITILFLLFVSACTTNSNTKKDIPKVTNMNNKFNKSLVLVFDSNIKPNFWQEFESEFFEYYKELHQSGKINFVLPFTHKPLKHPDKEGTWTSCIIIGLNSNTKYNSIAKKIVNLILSNDTSFNLKSADIMQLQDGLDMFYSVKDGLKHEDKLDQIVEYVFSNPSAREKYYEEQYLFSGPAMAELHSNGMAGRFIGYELEKRLFGKNFPQWDLIHIVGFTKEQTEKATPIFLSTFDKHAENVFGKGMTFNKVLKEWDKIRVNIKSNAKQNMNMTLQMNHKK